MNGRVEKWGESYLYTLAPPDYACFTCDLPTCINNNEMPYRMPHCNWRKAYDAFVSDEQNVRNDGWVTILEAEKLTGVGRYLIYKFIDRREIRHKWVWRTPQSRVLYVHPDDFKWEGVVDRDQDVLPNNSNYLYEEEVK